jgi:alpha-glucosidase
VVWQTHDQLMLGENIIIAPVLDRAQTVRHVYLPGGRWWPFEGGAPLDGGAVHTIKLPLGSIPAFIRDGAILPMAGDNLQSTQDYASSPVVFAVYGDTASGAFIEDDGVSEDYLKGCYNAYKLKFNANGLKVEKTHGGYKRATNRDYFILHNGKRTPINL